MAPKIKHIESFEQYMQYITYCEKKILETMGVPSMAMKQNNGTLHTELNTPSYRVALMIAREFRRAFISAELRRIVNDVEALYEEKMANRNIEYAQALVDYAQ